MPDLSYNNEYGTSRKHKGGSTMKRRSVMLLIALIIAMGYVILQGSVIVDGFKSIEPEANTMEEVGTQIGTTIGVLSLLPHVLIIAVGVVFNTVAWIGKQRWAALTSAILYTVGGVLGLMYFVVMIVPMILCYVAYGKMKSKEG